MTSVCDVRDCPSLSNRASRWTTLRDRVPPNSPDLRTEALRGRAQGVGAIEQIEK
jgi:hypothetical protein